VKKIQRKKLHSTLFNHGAFFPITRKEDEERKKGERGAIYGCTRHMWTNASKREQSERDSARARSVSFFPFDLNSGSYLFGIGP
jgi:hypothetical protein